MTPKDKAEMLLERFKLMIPREYAYTYDKYDMFVAKSIMQLLATSVVDEILYELDDHCVLSDKKEYYLKVKQEIKKQWRKKSRSNCL